MRAFAATALPSFLAGVAVGAALVALSSGPAPSSPSARGVARRLFKSKGVVEDAAESQKAYAQSADSSGFYHDVLAGVDLRKAYNLIDMDKDGDIDSEDLKRDARYFGVELTRHQARAVLGYLVARSRGIDLRKVFANIDQDRDGFVDMEELRRDAGFFGVDLSKEASENILSYLGKNARPDPQLFGHVRGGSHQAAASHADHGMQHSMDTVDRKESSKKEVSLRPMDEVNKISGLYQTVALGAVIAVVLFEALHTCFSEVHAKQHVDGYDAAPQELQHSTSLDPLGTWALVRLYWTCDNVRGWVNLGLAVGLEVCNIWISREVAGITSIYWNAIQFKDLSAFFALLRAVIPFIVFAVLVGSYSTYVRSALAIHWRTFLTLRLQKLWLQKHVFYKLRLLEGGGTRTTIDNPDQRIESDVKEFVTSSIELFFGLLHAFGTLLVFLPVLWNLSPRHVLGIPKFHVAGWLCWISLLYAGIGSISMHVVGRHLIRINYVTQRYEADFRSGLIRVREASEAIALLKAESWEEGRLLEMFRGIQRIFWEGMRTSLHISVFSSFYYFTSDLFPLFTLSPSYFAGHITLGSLSQARYAQGTVLTAFSWFMGSYSTLASFRSTCCRLREFFDLAEEASAPDFGSLAGAGGASSSAGLPAFRRLPCGGGADAADGTGGASDAALSFAGTVCLPSGIPLMENVSLEVPRGRWAMLSGPSGAGKTTMLRALVGLWPFGLGTTRCPEHAAMVPAESTARLLKGATLREVVTYPRAGGAFCDEDILAALRAVELDVLLTRQKADAKEPSNRVLSKLSDTQEATVALIQPEMPLDRREDWTLSLSSGQRQRLEFAFLLCARPQLVILDEPTAHLPAPAAVRLLRTMRRLLPPDTVAITVSHDPKLAECHDLQFAVDRDGITAVPPLERDAPL